MVAAVGEPKRVLVAFGRDVTRDFYHFPGPRSLAVKLNTGGSHSRAKAQVCPGHVHALSQFRLPQTLTPCASLSWGHVLLRPVSVGLFKYHFEARVCPVDPTQGEGQVD